MTGTATSGNIPTNPAWCWRAHEPKCGHCRTWMRERRFAALPDRERPDTDRVTVIVSRGTEDQRTTSPLEIVRGDRLRIGATHWEKQLFNGTVVTVDDFKVQRGEAGTEPSVLISARTEDRRKVHIPSR